LGEPWRPHWFLRVPRRLGLVNNGDKHSYIYEYCSVVQQMLEKPSPTYPRFPCVTPAWDNSARRQTAATILRESSPVLYERWLRGAAQKLPLRSPEWNFVFINAWNEWGEGNHLEPCKKWGRAYLEATRRAVGSG
jgi:hypothetical protein